VFRPCATRARRRSAVACAPCGAATRTLEQFGGDAYRAWFEFLVEDRLMFELMKRNAGPITALFGDPILGAGVEGLLDDLRAAITRGDLPAVATGFASLRARMTECRPSAVTTA